MGGLANLISVCTPAQLKWRSLINRKHLYSLVSHALHTKAIYWLVGVALIALWIVYYGQHV